MNSRLSAGWGMDWQGVESAKMDDPGVGRFRFVIASCDRGVNKKGKPYVNVGCKVVHVINGNQADKGKMKFEYLSLEPNRQPFTKAFFESIGAGRILMPGKGPEDAKGVMFEADVIINKSSDGREFKNMRNVFPFSYEEGEEEEPIESEEEEEPEEAEAEAEVEEEEEDVTPEDIAAMSLSDLKEFVVGNELQVDLSTIKGLKAKKQAVIDEIFDGVVPEPEPEPEPAKKKIKKAPVKGAVGGRR